MLRVLLYIATGLSSAEAQMTVPNGFFKLLGYTCQDGSPVVASGKKFNDDMGFGNEESIFQFKNGQFLQRTRRYSFDQYGSDHCLVSVVRDYKVVDDRLMLTFVKSDHVPVGKFGKRACRLVTIDEKPQKVKFTQNTRNVFMVNYADLEQSRTFCKAGLAFAVFAPNVNAEFSKPLRAARAYLELNHLDKIAYDPKSEAYLEQYIHFLLGEERVEDAGHQNAKLIALNAKSKFAAKVGDILKAYSANKDEKARDKDFLNQIAKLKPAEPKAVATQSAPQAPRAPAQSESAAPSHK